MKRFTVTAKITAEVEVDDRVRSEDFDWGIKQSFSYWEDGRRPFAVEMLLRGSDEATSSMLRGVTGAVGSRVSSKYPGVMGKEWMISDRIPEAKVVRIEREPSIRIVEVGDEKKCPNSEKLEEARGILRALVDSMTKGTGILHEAGALKVAIDYLGHYGV